MLPVRFEVGRLEEIREVEAVFLVLQAASKVHRHPCNPFLLGRAKRAKVEAGKVEG